LDAIKRLTRRDWLFVFLIAVFGMFGFTAFLLVGMKMIPGVTGAIVMATTPAVTAAAAILLIGESATWRKIAALVLAVGGVLLLHLGGGAGSSGGQQPGIEAQDNVTAFIQSLPSSTLIGSLLVFGAVCCEAAYTLLGRAVSQDTDPKLVAFLGASLSLPLFAPLAAIQWSSFAPGNVDWTGWTAVLWYGAGTLALGTWLWYRGISRAEGSVAAGFMGLMPVSALVLSYVLLGEAVRVMHLVGFAVVFSGVVLMSIEHARMADD
jgi:drug/metabolite transporter (DMT)-like permease